MDYDVVIVGGGPAGYPAAIRAAQLGMRAAIIEKEEVGGVCLNWGCIPTKALLHVAQKYDFVKNHAKSLGIKCGSVDLDFKGAIEYSRSVVKKLTSGVNFLLKKNNVDLFKDIAELKSDKSIALKQSGKRISAKNVIIATGASARSIKGLEFDNDLIWNYRDAMVPKKLPKSILIVGSGAIGMEFACIYNAFGCSVTVTEMQDVILPTEDKEISQTAEGIFAKRGIKIFKNCTVKNLDKNNDGTSVTLSNGKTINAEKILVAAGVTPNSAGIGIENFKNIKTEKGFIATDSDFKTQEENIYAIGDVRCAPCLAHKAIHEGILCVEGIAGKKIRQINRFDIPGCVYTFPQIASVGMTEEAAKQQGYQVKIGKAKPEANGKAVATGNTQGLIKTIFDKKTGELLGAHMIGHEVTEMLQGFVIAKNLEATDEYLRHVVFAHPTISESMHESVLDADGQAIHS